MPPSSLISGNSITSHHTKQPSIKTPTKMISSHVNANNNSSNQNDGGFASFSGEKKEDGMKVCRGPFNVNCTTSKDP
jgi:hypothetical protein